MERKTKKKSLVFAVNGERFELSSVDPSMTLLEFLRTKTGYKGPKLGCGEGGCGACVVLLSRFDPETKQVEEFSITSCLTLVCSVHLCSVTTTEGLGNSRDGFHSIHQRFAGFHASQCGFCTPGMCMSLYSALVNADKSRKDDDPPTGFSNLTVVGAEKAVLGNLCRCTGYRPIVDVCKSYASDVDIEDLGLNSFWRKGDNDDSKVNKLPFYDRDSGKRFPDFLVAEIDDDESDVGELATSSLDSCWYRPSSIDELHLLLKPLSVEERKRVKLVVGNTCCGVYKDLGEYDKYIDLKGVPDLLMIRRDDTGIEFGAAVTISQSIEALKGAELGQLPSIVFTKIADHLSKVASTHVRNTASLGGNLIMAQKYPFASDVATVLLAADSSVVYQVVSRRFVVTLEEFLEKSILDSNFILLSIRIPSWNEASKTSSDALDSVGGKPVGKGSALVFETYRAAPRPHGNAVSYVNAAFLALISAESMAGEAVLDKLQLVFGANGTSHATRARNVEKYLEGKSITATVMLKAINLLRGSILLEEGTSYPTYRSSVAVGFIFDFLTSLSARSSSDFAKAAGINGTLVNREFSDMSLDQVSPSDLLLSSKQVIKFSEDYLPVGRPTKKDGAETQASGEAVFVDDIPSPKDCLHGAFVYSTKPMARFKGINFEPASASQKITYIISVKNIPSGGKNIGSASIFAEDSLFADSITQYAGEPLALVIAETQRLANTAAAQAVIEYDTENKEPPILTVDQAVQKSSFFHVPPFLATKQVGHLSREMEIAELKILSAEIKLGSQYYFYMETQTALAVPDEDDCLVVYSSSQNPMMVQTVIAKCIGVPWHKVRVITRRVGGGFGGKALRSIPVATACALAAYTLRRPVRMYLDRKTDMVITGGRHPMTINYSVGFNSEGKITALHINLLINAGISEDTSPSMPYNIVGSLKKYNWGAFSCDYKVCKTNLSTKSAMRGPGDLQGSYIAEVVIEHVASVLSMDACAVRKINLHTFESLQLFYEEKAGEPIEYTLPCIVDKLTSSANFDNRTDKIRHFNSCNRWRKMGISCVPIIHPVTVYPKPGKVGILGDGSIVVEVGGIELGQGLWTKVKQAVAFSLGQLCEDNNEELLSRIRVVQADTLSLMQGGFTALSTTSEASCEAARIACDMLVSRLKPLKETIQKLSGPISWDDLIQKANFQQVNLSASSYFVPEASSMSYLNYGAAISEVEIDVLTGATIILRSDLIYDCGQSLNPAVDLGQIEGAFVQGIGFFLLEEYSTNADGLVTSDGTWTYKIPTVDTIPKQFNVEILNSGQHKTRVLSSKASGEPPLLLAASVHCAIRDAIKEARKDLFSYGGLEGSPLVFQLPVPATMPEVKRLCGFDNVELYLKTLVSDKR